MFHNQLPNILIRKEEEIENQEANDKAEKQAKPADSKEKTGGQPPKTEKAEETDIVYGESKDVIDACTFQRCITHLITTGNIS